MLRESTIVFIIAVASLVIFAVMAIERKNYNKIPKKIWTYWDNPDKIPKTVKMCMESWKKYNPDYEIILLTRKNYKGYINIPTDISSHVHFRSPHLFIDLLRLWTLTEHGGIWCDPTILMNSPLNGDWLFPKYAEFSGFYIDTFTQLKDSPVIEPWFLAANKGSQFIRKWRDEFTQIVYFQSVSEYINGRKKMGVDFQKIPNPDYLAGHIAVQKVLQIDKYPRDTLILKKAEDGPFKYLVDAKWNTDKALRLACSSQIYKIPIIMFRKEERIELDNQIEYDLSQDKCEWV
jgi:hypothetical protein